MAELPNKAGFLERASAAYQEYAAAVRSVPEAALVEPGAAGGWSVRDIMAHVGGDERWFAGQLEALLAGTRPTALSCYGDAAVDEPQIDLSTQDKRNAWQYERLRHLSLPDVRAMVDASHARLIALIESLSDADLTRELTIAGHGNVGWVRPARAGEEAWPLWQWLAGVTAKHYAEHTGQIRAAAGTMSQVNGSDR